PERMPEPEPAPAPEQHPAAELPDALLVKFESRSGSLLDGEGWEIEVLQMGGEVRVRGAVRAGGASAPIYRSMTASEYVDFWDWISAFPIDRNPVEEDASAPQEGWRKTCTIDVVLGPDRRILAENRWTRPLQSPAWMDELETKLHRMALDYAEEALRQAPPATEDTVDLDDGIRRALDALGESDAGK
ncbi:MAG: hypothetical protein ACRDGR_09740, partial [bacterium]